MNKIEQKIKELQEKGDSQFIVVANVLQREDEYIIDGRKVDKLLSHIRTGVYLVLPQIIMKTDMQSDDMMDFYSVMGNVKNLIGYEPEDIHLIIDRTIPENDLAPEVLKSLKFNFDYFVEELKNMDYDRRIEVFSIGGQIIELK